MTLVEDLQRLKEQQQDLERRRARREADIETAEEHQEQALASLREEFGVASITEARKLAKKMEKEIDREVAEAFAALEEAQ